MDRREDRRPATGCYSHRRAGMWLTLVLVLGTAAGYGVYDRLHQPLGAAPEFSLVSTGYENGTLGPPTPFRLSDHRGQTVVLDLMAVNCAACETVATRVLKPLHEEFGGRGDFAILSIDTWADPEAGSVFSGFENRTNLIALQEERDLSWRHALDTDEVWLKYAAVGLPKLVVVDPEQRIVAEYTNRVPSLAEVRSDVVAAMEGTAAGARGLRAPLLALAAVAGVAAFFAPCSIALVPAYLGLLLRHGREDRGGGPRGLALRAVGGGLAATAGVAGVYGAVAALLFLLGGTLARHLSTIQAVTGYALVVVGLLMLRPGAWNRLAARLGVGRIDGRRGFLAFGVGFGLASFGCTGPAFLPILLGGFAVGTATGLAAVGIYGGTLAALMLGAAGLVAAGHGTGLQRIVGRSEAVTRAAAALFVLAGAYVVWFHWQATGSLLL